MGDLRTYELTHEILDALDERGVDVDENIVRIARACASASAEMLAAFTIDEEGWGQ
jgi:hypothetical protein